MRALAPEVFAFLPGADFFRSLFSPGERVFKPARMPRCKNEGFSPGGGASISIPR
jgi:hypothetical protein